jgi:hemerythrin
MIAQTARTIGLIENAVDTDITPLLKQLSEWWTGHITGVDRKYIGYVTKLGLP